MGTAEVVEAGAFGWVGVKIDSCEGEVVYEICAGRSSGAGVGGMVYDANKGGRVACLNVVRVKNGRGSDNAETIRVGCGGSEDKEAGEFPAGGLEGPTVAGGFVAKGDRCGKGGGHFGLVDSTKGKRTGKGSSVVVLDEGRIEGWCGRRDDGVGISEWSWSWGRYCHVAGRRRERRLRRLRRIAKKGRKDNQIEERW